MFSSKKKRLIEKWRERSKEHYEYAAMHRKDEDEEAAELSETVGAVYRICALELENL